MTTQINVAVDSGGLLERSRQQQAANRQAFVEGKQRTSAEQTGTEQRQERLTAEGRNANGDLFPGRRPQLDRYRQEPAAYIARTLVKADYYVFKYNFNTGRDLDTRTQLYDPLLGTFSPPLGWCKDNVYPAVGDRILSWGGDNTGLGAESALFDRKNFEAAYGTNKRYYVVKLSAFWYNLAGSIVTIEVTGYDGGEMIVTDYTWSNPTATKVYDTFTTYPTSSVTTQQSDCIDGDFITYAVIDYSRGRVIFTQNAAPYL